MPPLARALVDKNSPAHVGKNKSRSGSFGKLACGMHLRENVYLRDTTQPNIDSTDSKRIEIVATGLSANKGIPLAIDATLVSPLHRRITTGQHRVCTRHRPLKYRARQANDLPRARHKPFHDRDRRTPKTQCHRPPPLCFALPRP